MLLTETSISLMFVSNIVVSALLAEIFEKKKVIFCLQKKLSEEQKRPRN
jgi:ethanolamine utilization cobalamin adenosyltransferase